MERRRLVGNRKTPSDEFPQVNREDLPHHPYISVLHGQGFVIVAVTGRAAVTSGQAGATAPGEARTILVVEDDPAVRRLICVALEGASYAVLLAENGKAGVEVFMGHSDEIACVVLDMTMPIMGGPGAYRRIREVSPTVPVVLISGFSAEDFAEDLGDRSHSLFMRKPFRPKELLHRIEELSATARR